MRRIGCIGVLATLVLVSGEVGTAANGRSRPADTSRSRRAAQGEAHQSAKAIRTRRKASLASGRQRVARTATPKRARATSRPITRRYAALYVESQQRYNAGRPSERLATSRMTVRDPLAEDGPTDRMTGERVRIDPATGEPMRFADHLDGEVLYWDLPIDDPRIEAVGEVAGSPFRVGASYRQFVHYLDFARQEQLESITGRPPQRMRARMTSSYRTLQIVPDRGEPFELKFPGEFRGGGKSLADAKVRATIARSNALTDVDYLAREPGALILHDDRLLGGHSPVIYRPLTRPVHTGDLLLPATALLAPDFAASPLGKRLFARHGGQAAWVSRQLAPRAAAIVDTSISRHFLQLELHQQNLDVLVSRDGRIRKLVVKDASDIVHDPVLEAVLTGKLPDRRRSPRNTAFLDIGQQGSELGFGVSGFQYSYGIGSLFVPHGDLAARAASDAFLRASPDLKARLHGRVADRSLSPAMMFASTIDEYRNQLILDRLEDPRRGFRRDPAARRWLDDRSRPLYAEYNHRAYVIPKTAEFGFVGKVPIAVTRDAGGHIDGFWLRLD